jgi:hypothetical protein
LNSSIAELISVAIFSVLARDVIAKASDVKTVDGGAAGTSDEIDLESPKDSIQETRERDKR